MNFVEQKLSSMSVGSPVRLTQLNGQIIEGILSGNDKTTALEVTVTAKVTLMYSQVTGIEENNAFGMGVNLVPESTGDVIQPVDSMAIKFDTTKREKEAKPETQTDIKLNCTEYDLRSSFKMMEKDAKNKLNPILSKIVSAIKAHDELKIKECADFSWNIMEDNGYEDNPDVNLFYAYVCAFAGEYYNSSLSFYYANDMRNAYRAAYYGACKNDDTECYEYAIIFASIYCKDKDSEFIDEAVEVIKISSEKIKDIGGIRYLVNMNPTDLLKKLIVEAVKYLAIFSGADISSFDDLKKNMSVLETYYSGNKIAEEIRNYDGTEEETEQDITASSVSASVADEGEITKYNFFEGKGKITANDGKVYEYELSDIVDRKLADDLKAISKWDSSRTIPVKFKTSRKMGMDYAVQIIRIEEKIKFVPEPVKKDPNSLYTQGRFEEAIEYYRDKLDTPEWETVFAQIMSCYAALWNKNGDNGYSSEMAALIERMSAKGFTLMKSYEVTQQYFMKVQRYSDALDSLNFLIENCDKTDYNRILSYMFNKARCYRHIKDYASAISQLNDWLEIVKTNRITERYDMRKSTIFVELAELYYELEDYENAERFANDASDSERKHVLIEKLEKLNESLEGKIGIRNEEEDTENEELMMTLNEAYYEYIDDVGFNGLSIDDSIIVEKISVFDEKHLYCLIAWLTAVSRIVKKNDIKSESVLYKELTMLQAIQSIEGAFSYAYQNPLVDCDYTSTEIVNLYEDSQNLLPKYNEGLMVSAVLRTLFNPGVQDYYLDDLICVIETLDVSNKYPMLINLLSEMKKFYDNTGCAIDAFAGYRSNVNVIDSVIQEAKELCDSIEKRNDIFESQGQVRRLRETMLSDEKSVLRKCLNIVAENNVSEFKYVRSNMEKMFIRNNRSLTFDNVDILKIDAFIDEYWDKARDIILSEGRHIERPHDKIKGSKRTNIVNTIKKIISCICDWLAVAEHSGNTEEAYIMKNYDAVAPQIISMMRDLHTASNKALQEEGFDWGTNSIYITTSELLAKMEGTYNTKYEKYFFIGFLSREDVLLDENYLPELESTFCGWGNMNILSRIEHHATINGISFEERLKQITSQDDTKHNFRTAKLLIKYAQDTNNTSLKSVVSSDDVNKCYKLVKQRFEIMYEEFCDEVELFENYGVISNMNGEKDSVLKLAFAWYKISRITGDYGFYIKMLDFIKNRISANAVKRGEELTRQLEDLADKPEYDFGIYTKEEILSLIEDQNYTSAESILNCIRRHDTKEVNDYTAEPYRYFSDFISEQQTDYRVVVGAGKSIVDAIAEYSGKKDMEFALQKLTNNARKETKGGAELIRNWMPKGGPARVDDLQRLLLKLGFNPVSVKRDENNMNIDGYIVYCQKCRGKVTYIHPIPAFGSQTETEGFRVACLYGKFDCNSLMNSFRMMNSTPKNTLVLLDFALNMEERRRLARKIKEEKSFSKTFIVVDRVILFYLAKHYAADTIAKRLMATTLPFAYCQPFVEASTQTMPPELFTGREDKLTEIESPQGVNLVYGGRQLGKSALLKMAQRNVDKNGNGDRAVWIEVKYKNYKEAAKQLSQELIIQGILDEKCECDNWDDLAKYIKIRLMDENPDTRINYLLVMIDEADVFIETSVADDNPPITAVKNIPSDRFKLVLAGTHNIVRFSKEVMHGNSSLLHLSYTSVTQFQRPEAIKLLTSTLAYLGFRFNKEVISNILNKTNFYPGLIQFYCQKLLEAMKSEDYAGYNELNTPYYEISESHFKKVLADSDFKAKVNEKLEASLFTEEKGRSYYHILALILAYLYYEMPAEKKYTVEDILRIAEEYKITRILNIDREKLEELLYEMWDLNIISKEDNFYRFATEGFRELLGGRKQVEDGIDKYFEEVIS